MSTAIHGPLGGRSRQKLTSCPENPFTLGVTWDRLLIISSNMLSWIWIYHISLLRTRNQDKIAYFSFSFLFWCLSHHLVRNTDPGAIIAVTWIQSNSVLFSVPLQLQFYNPLHPDSHLVYLGLCLWFLSSLDNLWSHPRRNIQTNLILWGSSLAHTFNLYHNHFTTGIEFTSPTLQYCVTV